MSIILEFAEVLPYKYFSDIIKEVYQFTNQEYMKHKEINK